MGVRLAALAGKAIYDTNAAFRGTAHDFIIDLEAGKVDKIVLEPLKIRTKKEALEILKKKTLPFSKVVAAKDIILIDDSKTVQETPAPAPTPQRRGLPSFLSRR